MTISHDNTKEEYVAVVWFAVDSISSDSHRGRFETLRKIGSQKPLAWKMDVLSAKYPNLVRLCHYIDSRVGLEEIVSHIFSKPLGISNVYVPTEEKPLLIPITLAAQVLGWKDYHIQ